MSARHVGLLLPLFLVACYTPSEAGLKTEMQEIVVVGMPLAKALQRLGAAGFACAPGNDFTCTRTRQRLVPSSCIERINLKADKQPVTERRVVEVTIPPIACAGL